MAAPNYKVKTIKLPNLDRFVGEKIDQMEEDIEDEIQAMEGQGYELEMISGGDNFAVIIFKKST